MMPDQGCHPTQSPNRMTKTAKVGKCSPCVVPTDTTAYPVNSGRKVEGGRSSKLPIPETKISVVDELACRSSDP